MLAALTLGVQGAAERSPRVRAPERRALTFGGAGVVVGGARPLSLCKKLFAVSRVKGDKITVMQCIERQPRGTRRERCAGGAQVLAPNRTTQLAQVELFCLAERAPLAVDGDARVSEA